MDISSLTHQSNPPRGHEYSNIAVDGNIGAHFGDNIVIRNETAIDGQTRADIRRRELLSALAYDGISARRRQLAQHSADYLEWIWDGKEAGGPSFTDWLSSDAPLYWITGKPGSGKSTLVKYIVENKHTQHLLTTSLHPRWTIIHFYFDFRAKTSIPNSLDGLLRSVLIQLAAAIPAAEKCMHYDRDGREIDFKNTDLHLDELRRMIGKCIAETRKSHSVCAFLDGLDEYAGKPIEIVRMVDFLRKAGVSKICCASRPENVLLQHFASKPHLRMHDRNHGTIRAFVSETLSGAPLIPSELNLQDLISNIVDRSQGVILWSHLVSNHLVDGMFEGETSTEILARLEYFPKELDEAYNRLLSSVDSSKEIETAVLLSLIQSATEVHRNNTVWALHRAMAYLAHTDTLPSWPRGKVTLSSFLVRLRSRTGSMIDIVSLSSRATDSDLLHYPSSDEIYDRFQSHDLSVRLFHQTLQAYIEKSGWVRKILEKSVPEFDYESPWKSLCLDCLGRYTLTDDDFSRVFMFLQSARKEKFPSQHHEKYEFDEDDTLPLALALYRTELVDSDLAFLDCALAIYHTFDISYPTTLQYSNLIQLHVLRESLRPFEGHWLRCMCRHYYQDLDRQYLAVLLQFTLTERAAVVFLLHQKVKGLLTEYNNGVSSISCFPLK